MSCDFDVVIAGAGPTGAAAGLWLAQRGLSKARITLVDARCATDAQNDPRMIALSYGSKVLLEELGVWHASLGTPIRQIHVSQHHAFGRTIIDCADYGVEALGYVVRYGELALRFEDALARDQLQVIRGQRVTHVTQHHHCAEIGIDDGRTLMSAYAVHAEGGLFGAQTTRRIHRDYAQVALVSFVTCQYPQVEVAWERFTHEGPIALLPAIQQGKSGLSLVWCGSPDAAQRRLMQEEPAFLRELREAFGPRLGAFTGVFGRKLFPLGLNAVKEIARGREFAIGNAAQTLHPVAGQGLNLGLRDAYTLADVLSADFEDPAACRAAFGRARRLDRGVTLQLTDILPRLFASALAPMAVLRAAALTLFDLAPPARHLLAQQMMYGKRQLAQGIRVHPHARTVP